MDLSQQIFHAPPPTISVSDIPALTAAEYDMASCISAHVSSAAFSSGGKSIPS